GVDIDLRISQHAADTSLHITRDYRDAMDNSLVHPSATNPFVTEESLNDAMTGSAKPGVQTLEDLAAIPPDQRADKDTRLVEDEGKIYRFDADADHGDVKPLEGPGWWIAVAAATQNHNNLSNLQGGSATERYHLTKAERDSLVAHLADTNNPHQVTPEQIGAETPSGAQAKVDAHASRTDNPHRVTAAQVGAYPVGSKVADSDKLDGQDGSYYASQASVDAVASEVASVSAMVTSVSSALNTHKSSGDHDSRYYTKSQLNTSGGGGQVHWNNITNKPSFPSSPVPVSQLKKAQGSYSASDRNENFAVHQYAFGSPYLSSDTRRWLHRPWPGAPVINPIVPIVGVLDTENAQTITWDYLTASGHPRVWAEVDERGEIVTMWEAEDPADADLPDLLPVEGSKDAEGNPVSDRLVLPLLMPDECAVSTVVDRLLTATRAQRLTESRLAAQVDPVIIHSAMCDEQFQERGLEIPDDIRAVFTDISDHDRRYWYLQLWLRQASRLLHDHRSSTLIPLYKEMFRVDRRTGRLVLQIGRAHV